MRKDLKSISIKKKMTITFVIFILTPTLLLCSYSYKQVQRYILSEIISSANSTLDQVKYNIMNKVEIIESVSSNICYNSGLEVFLKSVFLPSPSSIDEYLNIIVPIVEHAVLYHKFSFSDISVYMTNETIPEGYGYFQHERRIRDEDWYQNFMQTGKNAAWILPPRTGAKGSASSYTSSMLMFVRKISAPNDLHLGLITISLPQSEMFSSFNLPDDSNSFFAFTESGHVLFSLPNTTLPSEKVLEKIAAISSGHYITDNILYLVRTIDAMNIKICMVVPLSSRTYAMGSLTITLVILILLVLLMIIVFFIILQRVFKAINDQLHLMTLAIQNDFQSRIPVNRKDEIGQIAQNFNILLDKINALIKSLVIKETAHKDAQFKALQYQINPHFIYNTIDVYVNKLALAGNFQMADSIADFGRMLRYNIGRKEIFTTLHVEIDYIKSYIGIQKLRYEERLRLNINIPRELMGFKIIKFILQPIVENSIIHNMNGNGMTLEINIDARVSEEKLVISISDNGRGIEPSKLEELNQQFITSEYKQFSDPGSTNIGLQNINERIKLFYGNEYHLRMESVYGKGTTTILSIPIHTNVR